MNLQHRWLQTLVFLISFGTTLSLNRHALASEIVERGYNHRIIQTTRTSKDLAGRSLTLTNRYTEFESGLHFLDDSGQWQESQELIEKVQDGAVARHGQHKVHFKANINAPAAIDVTAIDNTHLKSTVLGIYLADSEWKLHDDRKN